MTIHPSMKSADVKLGRKSSEVYQGLKKQIVLAQLPAGQQLIELEVAKTVNCSQSTVREAMMRLQEDGLIVRQGYRGTVVSSVSAAEGQESLDIRARVESHAAHFSIGNFDDARVEALCGLVRRMEAAADADDEYGLFELDQEFHRAVYEAANLPALLPILERCSLCSHRFKIAQSATRRTLRETAMRHWSIIDAIKTGDAQELERVMFHHVASVIGEVDEAKPTESADLRMSDAMAAIFERTQKEDAHLPNPMLIGWDEAQANFHQTAQRWNQVNEAQFHMHYFSVPGVSGPMTAVRIMPRKGARTGTLLYLHGGGWVFGSIQTHLGAMARLAEVTGLSVVGVDYGMAPGAPFPQGLNDAVGAWRWLRTGSCTLDLSGPWLVSGDSAGANIALSLMLDLKLLGEPLPDAALLFYGVYSADHQTVSHKQCGGGQFGLSTAKMAWYRQQYLSGTRQNADDPRVSPALGELQGLPPIYMNAAGLDCLRDDSTLLARRLAEAGVAHVFKVVPGVTHGFMQMSSELPEALAAFHDAADFVARVLPPAV